MSEFMNVVCEIHCFLFRQPSCDVLMLFYSAVEWRVCAVSDGAEWIEMQSFDETPPPYVP